MKGPGYTVDDLIYYLGLFGGIIVTYQVLAQFDVMPIIRLIAGLVVGVGLGFVSLSIYKSLNAPPPQDPDDPSIN